MKHSIKFTLCALVILNVHIGFVLRAQEAPPQSHIERNDEPGLEPIDPASSDSPIIASLIKNETNDFVEDPHFTGSWELSAAFFAPECKPQNESDCTNSLVEYPPHNDKPYIYTDIYKHTETPYFIVTIHPYPHWENCGPQGSCTEDATIEYQMDHTKRVEDIRVKKFKWGAEPYGILGFTEKTLKLYRTDLANIPSNSGGTIEENRRYQAYNVLSFRPNLITHYTLHNDKNYFLETTYFKPCYIAHINENLMYCAVHLGSDHILYPRSVARDLIIYRFERLML